MPTLTATRYDNTTSTEIDATVLHVKHDANITITEGHPQATVTLHAPAAPHYRCDHIVAGTLTRSMDEHGPTRNVLAAHLSYILDTDTDGPISITVEGDRSQVWRLSAPLNLDPDGTISALTLAARARHLINALAHYLDTTRPTLRYTPRDALTLATTAPTFTRDDEVEAVTDWLRMDFDNTLHEHGHTTRDDVRPLALAALNNLANLGGHPNATSPDKRHAMLALTLRELLPGAPIFA